MRKQSFLRMGCIYFVLTYACSTSLFSQEDDFWDGEKYHQNSSSQKDAAFDLLKYIPLKGSERLLDIGCGDGKISALLAEELFDGSVLGTDVSVSMISFAKHNFPKDDYPNLDFILLEAEEIHFENEFDAAVSFTALQWARDHRRVVKNVYNCLKPNGLFGVTMPMGLPIELEIAVYETIKDDTWSSFFEDFDTGWNFVQKSMYGEMLQEEGFSLCRLEIVKQEDVFESLEVFRGFISQWFPYLRALPNDLKNEFMKRVLARYTELEPLDHLGRVHFIINRLEVVAEKNPFSKQ